MDALSRGRVFARQAVIEALRDAALASVCGRHRLDSDVGLPGSRYLAPTMGCRMRGCAPTCA